jgi:hypothetical protein
MRLSELARRYFSKPHDHTVGHIDVAVEADYQPAEEDTNTEEGVELTAAYFEDEGCILDEFNDEEQAQLRKDVLAGFHSYCEGRL